MSPLAVLTGDASVLCASGPVRSTLDAEERNAISTGEWTVTENLNVPVEFAFEAGDGK